MLITLIIISNLATRLIFKEDEDYYYHEICMDCVGAINFLSTREEIGISRFLVTSASQG